MDLNQAVETLVGLAQRSRLAIFRALVQAGEAGLQPTPLADALRIPANTLSFHLKGLLAAGLVSQERRGRTLTYRADFDGMGALIDFLTRDCCGGRPCATTQRRRPAARIRQAVRP